MSFFLQPYRGGDQAPVTPSADISSYLDGLWGSAKGAALENDANFKASRTVQDVRRDRSDEIMRRIGMGPIQEHVRTMNEDLAAKYLPARPVPQSPDEVFGALGSDYHDILADMARQQAEQTPEAWADLDLTPEWVESEANARLQAEYADAQAIVEMMPGGQASAGFLGGMAGATLDVKNLPFLMLGAGGGSFARVMGREAMINMGAEAAFLPSQFAMADRLDIEDPDIIESLSQAAVAGAAFGGLFEAGARAWRYLSQRNKAPSIPGYDDVDAVAMMDLTEDALTSGRADAFDLAAKVPEQFEKQPPYLLENPINPQRPPLVVRPAEPAPEAPLPAQDAGAVADDLRQAAEEAAKAGPTSSRPLIEMLGRRRAKITRTVNGVRQTEVETTGIGIDPDSPLAAELKARGITSRTAPNLYKRGGRTSLDTLVASEMEESFPGITAAAGLDANGNYLDEQGLIDLIVRDHDRDTSWLQTRQIADDLNRQADEAERGVLDDILEGRQEPGGFFIDPNVYLFNEAPDVAQQRIAEDVTAYLERSGYGSALTPEEAAEIISEAQRNGGDIEYLVERAFERELDFAKTPEQPDAILNDIPFDEPTPRPVGEEAGGGDGPAVRSEPVTGPAGGGGQGADGIPADAGAVERTAAGEQSLIPGVAPITKRDRLQSQMNRPMRGGDAATDIGLFDTGARAQMDMFSEPDSPAFQDRLQTQSADVRAEIEAGGNFDMEMDLGDGRTLKTASDVLDYLDEGDLFSARIDLCGKGPT